MRIRDDIPAHMAGLRAWLDETRDAPLEGMGDFFAARVDGYEEHMSPWREAYRRVAELVPRNARTLLDIGCGTGLELDEILRLRPGLSVTGVDLSPDMLARLRRKHPGVRAVNADYFACELGESAYDMALSFETLHHFAPALKQSLFERLHRALAPGGCYVEADYIACCLEEEAITRAECERRRARDHVPPDRFVHFDTPLTLEHETALLRAAGFARVTAVDCVAGACILLAQRS